MKNITFYLICLLFIFIISNVVAQDLEKSEEELKSTLENVTIKDVTYEQSIKYEQTNGHIVTISSKESKKGKTTKYRFNLEDIDKEKIKFESKKNYAEIELATRKNDKLIRVAIDDEIVGYDNKISLRATNLETARKVDNLLYDMVTGANNHEVILYNESSSLVEVLDYLENNMSQVKINEDNYEQSFGFDNDNPVVVTFYVNYINKALNESFKLNFGDVNKEELQFVTRGSEVLIEVNTNNKEEIIEYAKNGKAVGFKDKFELHATTIEEGRKLLAALINLKELSNLNQIVEFDNTGDYDKTLQFLKNKTRTIDRGNGIFEQSLESFDDANTLHFSSVQKDKKKTSDYYFNPIDMLGSSVQFNTKGGNIFVSAETGKKSLVQYKLNGSLENYADRIDIQAPDIESARSMVSALERLIALSKQSSSKFSINEDTNPETKAALDHLIKYVNEVNVNNKIYRQSLFYEEDNLGKITLEVIDPSKNDKRTFELDLRMVDPSTIDFDTKTKMVFVTAEIKGKEDLIKSTKNDEDVKNVDTLNIVCPNIKTAREIVEILRYIVSKL